MHQLFILDHFSKKGNQIFLFNVPELLFQLRKVLRATLGETLFVQPENGAVRYEIKLTYRTDRDLVGEIIECVTFAGNECLNNVTVHSVMMFIAMPNKREKAALIVQKLSEIGVDQIGFRPAERSVLRQWNEKKADRLQKIAKEAVEQSRGRKIPAIVRCENVHKACEGKEVVVFDMVSRLQEDRQNSKGGWCGIIGPEGGLTPSDYKNFPSAQKHSLGTTVLRMETAAIVGAWFLKHRYIF